MNDQWKSGFALALTAAVLWGVLPIALDVVLQGLDAYTLTWFRFTAAAVLLGLFLTATDGLPMVKSFSRRVWQLLAVALVGLAGNYLLYVKALSLSSPSTAQVVGQLGPMFLLFGGLVIFNEHFSRLQWIGFAVLMAGLALFFNNRISELAQLSAGLGLGVTLQIAGCVIWAAYGLAQKRLLTWLGPQQILLLIYVGAVVLLFPWTAPRQVHGLGNLQLTLLGFCCLNTVAAYGAFAEGLKRWEVSRFSAVLATSPLFTVSAMRIMERFKPDLVVAERLNMLSIMGTLLVVVGSATCALARRVE